MKYICVRCGKEFEAKHKTAICSDCRIQRCIICGKQFELKTPYTALTCSSKCRGIYRKQSGIGKKSAEKAKNTLEKRYGVSNASELQLPPKKCEYCGKIFIPKSARQKYCDDVHYGACPVCGKQVEIKEMSIGPQACSYECRQKLIESTNMKRYGVRNVFQSEDVKEKSKDTILERYGVDHYSKTSKYHEKVQETMVERYGEHPYKNPSIIEKRKSTTRDRLGVDYPMQSASVKEKARRSFMDIHGGYPLQESSDILPKIHATTQERYGTIHPAQNSDVLNKMKLTNKGKYGVENVANSPDVQEKRKKRSYARYGVPYPLMSDEVKSKIHDTVMNKYGVNNVFQSLEIQDKIQRTNLFRYGVTNPMQSTEIQEKMRSTNFMKYGSEYYFSSDEYLEKRMTDGSKIEEFKEFRDDVVVYMKSHYASKVTLTQLAKDLGVDPSTTSLYVLNAHAEEFIDYHKSDVENEVFQFIRTLYDGKIVRNTRSIIHPYEIDVYIPDMKLGIEVNPTYTHNSSKSTHWSDFIVPYTYHRDKTIEAEKAGIRLIHIFGYDWTHKRDIVESMLRNVFKKNTSRYYARNLEIRNTPYNECHKFLDENHIQGATSSRINLGLYDNDTLISCMTFNKPRYTMGYHKEYSTRTWELSRFCTLLNTTCVGGASKLFKYFLQEYCPDKVISFSNRSNTSGSVYSTLGFRKDSEVSPGYVWVHGSTDVAFNRVLCQKRNLRKFFDDDSIDIENQTESEIMESRGFVKVYNSGLYKWVYVNEECKEGDHMV